jgi:hypothetical protein
LESAGMDVTSIQMFFFLAQEDLWHARGIVWRLMQKYEAGDGPRNPSGWLTSAVHDCRKKLWNAGRGW